MMRVSLLLVLVAVLSLLALVHCVPDAATHVDAMEQHELDLDIQQPARTTPTPTTAPTRTTPRTPTTPTPTRTPARTRARRSPRSPLTGLLFPRRDPFRLDLDMDFRMSPRVIRFSMLERRMLRRMFRAMLRQRMREMFGLGYPMSHMEMRVIRMITLRDMMEAMDMQAQDAAELATIVDQREADLDEQNEPETYDDTTETETEPETEAEPETEHEVEAIPEEMVVDPDIEDPRLIDPTLIESEFDISAPYGGGGYGGFGGYGSKKGGFGYGGGFGGKKGGFGGGFGFGGKKIPYKKVPYKKVPFPVKKGGFGYGGYGYGGKKGGFY